MFLPCVQSVDGIYPFSSKAERRAVEHIKTIRTVSYITIHVWFCFCFCFWFRSYYSSLALCLCMCVCVKTNRNPCTRYSVRFTCSSCFSILCFSTARRRRQRLWRQLIQFLPHIHAQHLSFNLCSYIRVNFCVLHLLAFALSLMHFRIAPPPPLPCMLPWPLFCHPWALCINSEEKGKKQFLIGTYFWQTVFVLLLLLWNTRKPKRHGESTNTAAAITTTTVAVRPWIDFIFPSIYLLVRFFSLRYVCIQFDIYNVSNTVDTELLRLCANNYKCWTFWCGCLWFLFAFCVFAIVLECNLCVFEPPLPHHPCIPPILLILFSMLKLSMFCTLFMMFRGISIDEWEMNVKISGNHTHIHTHPFIYIYPKKPHLHFVCWAKTTK